MRIAVIAADGVIGTQMATIVRERGHEAVVFASGDTAWRSLRAAPCAVLLIDELLPGLDGLDVCRRVRQAPWGHDVVIVVLTAGAGADSLATILAAGADDIVAKPIDPALLAVRLTFAERLVETRAARRAAEAALATREARERALAEHATELVHISDAAGIFLDVNPAYQRVLGYAPRDLLGTNVWALIHPDDRPALSAAVGPPEGEGAGARAEFRLRHADGSWRWVEAISVRRLHDPVVDGVVVISRDVTARHQADEQLRFQGMLLDAVGQAVIATDLEGRITSWNRAAADLYGWAAAEVLGRPVAEVVVAPGARDQAAAIMAALRRGASWTGEFPVQRRDGTVFPAQVTDTALYDPGGQMVGMIGVSADISARTEAVEQLHRRDAYFHALLDNAPDVVLVLSAEGTVVYESPSMERIFGYPRQERQGRSILEFIHPDDQARVGETFAALRGMPGAVASVEFRLRHRDGGWRYMEVSGKNMLAEPSVGGLVVNARDTTTRRQAEEILRTQARVQESLAALALLATGSLDSATLLSSLSAAAARAFDLHQAGVWLLEGPETLRLATTATPGVSPTLRVSLDGMFAAAQAVRARGPRIVNLREPAVAQTIPELLATFPAASVALAAPLFIGEEIVGALSLVAEQPDRFGEGDINVATQVAAAIGRALHNARLYQREHDLATRLEQMDRWRDSFVRVMAHELRTPLGQILGFAELLTDEKDRLSPARQRHLTHVQTAAARLQGLIDRMFEVMSLVSEGAALVRHPLDLGTAVEAALGALSGRAGAAGIRLDLHRPAVPLLVQGDLPRLHRLVGVVLDNALRYTPPGGRVEVTVATGGDGAEVRVCDTGPGIPPEVRASLFSGGQVEDVLTRSHGGLGLSLLVARRIAEMHGGRLWLDQPAQGTCVVLWLPAPSPPGTQAAAHDA